MLSGSMPMPVSLTTSARPSETSAAISTRPPELGELDRVRQGIQQDLPHSQPIAVEPGQLGRRRQPSERDPSPRRHRRDQPNRLVDDRLGRYRLFLQRRFAGFVPGQVERVIDDREQMPSAKNNVVEVVAVGRVAEGAERFRLHDLGKADDGAQRAAQLVAHFGEQIRVGAVCRGGPGRPPPQFVDRGAAAVELLALPRNLGAHCRNIFGEAMVLGRP